MYKAWYPAPDGALTLAATLDRLYCDPCKQQFGPAVGYHWVAMEVAPQDGAALCSECWRRLDAIAPVPTAPALPPQWDERMREITQALDAAIRLNADLHAGRTDDILAWLRERQRAEQVAYGWVDELSVTDQYAPITRALGVIINAASGHPERIPAALLLLRALDMYVRTGVAS